MTIRKSVQRGRISFLVYIVESPSSVDLYHKRYEGELLIKALDLAGIPSEHKLAVNLEAFNASFTVGLQEHLSLPGALPPLLHISAHGDKKGIQLTNGEEIDWNKLRDILMPINKALNGSLILCMSSCQGINAFRMAITEGELPFFGVIGHSGEPSWSDTAIAYVTFYHLLAKGYNVQEAVKRMIVASDDTGFQEIHASKVKEIYIDKINKIRVKALVEKLRRSKQEIPESPLVRALRKMK